MAWIVTNRELMRKLEQIEDKVDLISADQFILGRDLERANKTLDVLAKLGERIGGDVERIDELVRNTRMWLLPIRDLDFTCVGELDMAIKFGIVLPEPPTSPDDWDEIASGELSVKIGEAEPVIVATAKADQLTADRMKTDDRFVGPQGAACSAQFVYVDDAGNKSKVPATLEFTLVDTVPPVDATGLGATMLEETHD